MLVGTYNDEYDGRTGHPVFNGTLSEFDEAMHKVHDYHLTLWDSFWTPSVERELKKMALFYGFDEHLLEFRDWMPSWQYLNAFSVDGSEVDYAGLGMYFAISENIWKILAPIEELSYTLSLPWLNTLEEEYKTRMDAYMTSLGFQHDFLLLNREYACKESNKRQHMREMTPEQFKEFQELLHIERQQSDCCWG